VSKLNSTLIASLLASAAFAASPALADGTDFSGLLGGDYAHLSADHGFGDANVWGVTGSGVVNFGTPGLAAEGDAGYQNFSGNGSSNLWNVDGSLFWRMPEGRIGGVIGYDSASNGGGHTTNYGGFGEWFAGSSFTLGAKGGGFNASFHSDGYYAGGNLTGYVIPDFALSGGIDYTHFNHFTNETDWNLRAEYLLSERVPVSIWGGYTNSNLSNGGPDINAFLVGVNLYFNGNGGTSLVDRQRDGAARWGTSFAPIGITF